ncbi:helix-turn-helix transcriptional regulator [Streptosporangium sp. NPDC000239]|uniref:helix-turn-helix domain-containing protein n=1 Tax=Streptosporangium sp. NPDC000239 TaxID=3154248 RepID=UPI00332D34C2
MQRIARANVTGQSTPNTSTGWQEFGRALRIRREHHGLSLRDLAEQIRWNYSLISKWEQGKNRPPVEAVKALDAELGAGGELMAQALHAAMTDADQARKGTVEAKASTRDEDEDMERRRLMRDAAVVAVGGAVAPALAALTDAWQVSQPSISGASVSQAMIDDWEDAADVHAKAARVESPAVVLAALAADFAEMAPHLARNQPDAVRRDLAHAAARHTALIAGKWTDMGNRRQAHRWWSTTRTLIDESGDRLLASWLRSREAIHRRSDPAEDLAEVLKLSQEARRLAGSQPSAPLVAALTTEAKTLAAMGSHADAINTLQEAERAFDQLPAASGAFRSLSERGLWFDRSLIYTLASDVRNATQAQDAAEALYPVNDQTSPRIRLHRVALHARTDPENAAHEALRIVDGLPSGRWMTRYTTDTHLVLGALPEHARTLPVARELRALTVNRSA